MADFGTEFGKAFSGKSFSDRPKTFARELILCVFWVEDGSVFHINTRGEKEALDSISIKNESIPMIGGVAKQKSLDFIENNNILNPIKIEYVKYAGGSYCESGEMEMEMLQFLSLNNVSIVMEYITYTSNVQYEITETTCKLWEYASEIKLDYCLAINFLDLVRKYNQKTQIIVNYRESTKLKDYYLNTKIETRNVRLLGFSNEVNKENEEKFSGCRRVVNNFSISSFPIEVCLNGLNDGVHGEVFGSNEYPLKYFIYEYI